MHPKVQFAPLKVVTTFGTVGFYPEVSSHSDRVHSYWGIWVGELLPDIQRDLAFLFSTSIFHVPRPDGDEVWIDFDRTVLRDLIETVLNHQEAFVPLCRQALSDLCAARFGERFRPKIMEPSSIELLEFNLFPTDRSRQSVIHTMKLEMSFLEGPYENGGITSDGNYTLKARYEVERTPTGDAIRFLQAIISP
jgi:hypothetical protein